MPERSRPKRRGEGLPLSKLNDGFNFVRVACACCKRRHHYFPSDLLRIFGDIEVDDVSDRMRCEGCGNPSMTVDMISPIGSEAVGLRIRRLVAIKVQRVPIWRED